MKQKKNKSEWYARRITAELERILDELKLKINSRDDVERLIRRLKILLENALKEEMIEQLRKMNNGIINEISRTLGIKMKHGKLDEQFLREQIYSLEFEEVFKKYGDWFVRRLQDTINEVVLERGADWYHLSKRINEELGVGIRRARTIARTELANMYNNLLEWNYRKAESILGEMKYKWVNPLDSRTTECCRRIVERTKNGVSLEELKEIIREESERYFPGFYREDRPFLPHYNCYKDGYVLTVEGWKRFEELKEGEEIWGIDENGRLVKDKILRVISYNYRGKMYKIWNRWFEIEVTEDHPFLVLCDKKIVYRAEVDELRKGDRLIVGGLEWEGEKDYVEFDGKRIDGRLFCRFLGWYLAEGHYREEKYRRTIWITQEKEENYEEIVKVLEQIFGKVWKCKGKVGVNMKGWNELFGFLKKLGKSYERYIPKEIKKLSKECLEELIDAYLKGDGYIREERGGFAGRGSVVKKLFTSSFRLMSDLVEVALKLGYSVSLYKDKSEGKEEKFKNGSYIIKHSCWRIGLRKSKTATVKRLKFDEFWYEGKVWDIETERTGSFIYWNGKGTVYVSSNCRSRMVVVEKV